MTDEVRQYGNFRKPMTAGIGKLNRFAALALMAQCAVGLVLFSLTHNYYFGGFIIVYLLLFVALMVFPDKHGMTPMQHVVERISFMWFRKRGYKTYHAPLDSDATPPPGVLSAVRFTDEVDGHGKPFSIAHFPKTNQAAVIFKTSPVGGELHDEETKDGMVAATGGLAVWLANQPGVDMYTYTVETGPNYGTTALQAVERQIEPGANPVARRVMRDTVRMGSASKNTMDTYAAFTFAAAPDNSRNAEQRAARDAAVAADIARRIPGIKYRLKKAGSGPVTACTAAETAERVRIAFDPRMAKTVELSRLAGNEVNIEWQNAGPMFADDLGNAYEHDNAYSVTFRMTNASRGTIVSDCMRDMLAPHPDIHRKRVTLVRHPIDSSRANDIAEAGFNNARVRADSKRAPATANNDLKIAEAVRNEVATGAALENFTVIITATVLDRDKIEDAVAAVEGHLTSMPRMDVRMMYGAMDFGFAVGLGIGFDGNAHTPFAGLHRAIG